MRCFSRPGKVLDEFKDKIDASTKEKIEKKVKELEEARKADDAEAISRKIEELNKTVQEIEAKIYQDMAAQRRVNPAGRNFRRRQRRRRKSG